MKKFSLPLENVEQITKKGDRVLSTNFTPENQNQKIEGLITYSIDQQIFKFKAIIGHQKNLKTIYLDELNNLDLWGANDDFNAYDKKWSIHCIHPCVMMRKNLKTKSCEYM